MHNEPCKNCGHCPSCGQPMPVLGPYPYYIPPPIPYTIPIDSTPWVPAPRDIFVGDPPPGWSTVTMTQLTSQPQCEIINVNQMAGNTDP